MPTEYMKLFTHTYTAALNMAHGTWHLSSDTSTTLTASPFSSFFCAVYAPNVLQQEPSEGLIKFSYLAGMYGMANQPSVRFLDCHGDRIPNAPGILLRKAANYRDPDNMWWEGVIQGTFRRMWR